MKIHFISFASSNFSRTLERIKKEAIESEFFDVIQCFTEKDIPEFYNKYENWIKSNPRGFGYWLWKPYIIKKYLSTMSEEDILIYLDSGCTINKNGKERFNEYIKWCIKSPFKNLSFQYNQYKEYQYTKGDIINYFNLPKENIYSGQTCSGFVFLQKCNLTCKMIDDWCNIMINNFNLIDDSPSKIKNYEGFVENRHDQSILSCLRFVIGSHFIKNEFDIDLWGEHNLHKFKEKLPNSPFWATRIKY
jgi:hypothetical protein